MIEDGGSYTKQPHPSAAQVIPPPKMWQTKSFLGQKPKRILSEKKMYTLTRHGIHT
jgi:hypothetical protein